MSSLNTTEPCFQKKPEVGGFLFRVYVNLRCTQMCWNPWVTFYVLKLIVSTLPSQESWKWPAGQIVVGRSVGFAFKGFHCLAFPCMCFVIPEANHLGFVCSCLRLSPWKAQNECPGKTADASAESRVGASKTRMNLSGDPLVDKGISPFLLGVSLWETFLLYHSGFHFPQP